MGLDKNFLVLVKVAVPVALPGQTVISMPVPMQATQPSIACPTGPQQDMATMACMLQMQAMQRAESEARYTSLSMQMQLQTALQEAKITVADLKRIQASRITSCKNRGLDIVLQRISFDRFTNPAGTNVIALIT